MWKLLQWIVRFFRPEETKPHSCEPQEPVIIEDISPEPDFETLEAEIGTPVQANGLRHNWRTATARWLYPGLGKYWIASHRMCQWDTEKIDEYLSHPDIKDTTHVIICPNTAERVSTNEHTFDGLKSDANERKVRAVFEQVIAADKAPILWCMSQEFFIQVLDRQHQRLLEYLQETCALLSDLSQIAVPMRELGDIYGGRNMRERNAMFKAMRKGAPQLPLAEHERALEQIPVDDFRDVGGTVISGLQTGFGTATGGQNRPGDRVQVGNHTYDGACGFLQENHDRMLEWQEKGRMEEHVNALFEHSLPLVYPDQSWGPTRTLEEAKARGRILLKHGVAFDLSSGVRLGD
jgi:hypothetical protein